MKGALLLTAAVLGGIFGASGDQLEMVNGDRYTGKVVSLSSNLVVWQSEIFGTVNLPREKVVTISLGAGGRTNLARIASPAKRQGGAAGLTNAAVTNGTGSLRQLSANTNLIQQVQSQFLSDADPAAKAKYNELMGGLLTGKLSVEDIRAQAKAAAEQLRVLKKEGGDDTGLYDSYLAILDKFVGETAPGRTTSTNAPGAEPKPKLPASGEKE